MISEQLMEDKIAENPDLYLGEEGLRLVARQYTIGTYRFDLIFEDRHGSKLIVELQRGTLDRNHTYKILDYYDEYKEANPKEFIELMVIANNIPQERKKRLASHGISFREIPEREFLDEPAETSENQVDVPLSPQHHRGSSPAHHSEGDMRGTIPGFKHPRNASASWHQPSLVKVEAWMRARIQDMQPGTIVSVGEFAKASRAIGHIQPQGNINGMRYLLSLLHGEHLIDFPDNLHFKVVNPQVSHQ
ncbi:MAG: endonuclease NucS [Desulfomonilia bacterium]|nr:endonuclease NucS [Desulfomonilia bacterium]